MSLQTEAQRYALEHILATPEDGTPKHFGMLDTRWRYGLTVNL
jgi:hypothetical protein